MLGVGNTWELTSYKTFLSRKNNVLIRLISWRRLDVTNWFLIASLTRGNYVVIWLIAKGCRTFMGYLWTSRISVILERSPHVKMRLNSVIFKPSHTIGSSSNKLLTTSQTTFSSISSPLFLSLSVTRSSNHMLSTLKMYR